MVSEQKSLDLSRVHLMPLYLPQPLCYSFVREAEQSAMQKDVLVYSYPPSLFLSQILNLNLIMEGLNYLGISNLLHF